MGKRRNREMWEIGGTKKREEEGNRELRNVGKRETEELGEDR